MPEHGGGCFGAGSPRHTRCEGSPFSLYHGVLKYKHSGLTRSPGTGEFSGELGQGGHHVRLVLSPWPLYVVTVRVCGLRAWGAGLQLHESRWAGGSVGLLWVVDVLIEVPV